MGACLGAMSASASQSLDVAALRLEEEQATSSCSGFVTATSSSCSESVTATSSCSVSVAAEIQFSKRHWSDLSMSELSMSELSMDDGISGEEAAEVKLDNEEVFKMMERHEEWGHFFVTFGFSFGKWESEGSLEVGEKLAEGAEAELFHVRVKWSNPEVNEVDLEEGVEYVLKVFKEGTLVRHLQQQWPNGLFRYVANMWELNELGKPWGTRYICRIHCATLLEDGRFAFLMEKEDGDLRSLIERKMAESDHCCGPFSKEDGEEIMYRVAQGMDCLHGFDMVSRDLKASNILVKRSSCGNYLHCYVSDFATSNGVIGTGFWRAPEILRALRERNVGKRPELFSRAADTYSYGMTCYEVLIGKVPFEGHPLADQRSLLVDLVIDQHLRPEVPDYVDDWTRELLHWCWNCEVDQRPSFKEILAILEANSNSEYIRREALRRQ